MVGKSPNLSAPSPQSAYTGGCSASLAIVDGLNEFQRRGELHPPIALLPTQPTGIEIIDVLNSGQQAGRVCLEGRRCRDGPTLTAEKKLMQQQMHYNHKCTNVQIQQISGIILVFRLSIVKN